MPTRTGPRPKRTGRSLTFVLRSEKEKVPLLGASLSCVPGVRLSEMCSCAAASVACVDAVVVGWLTSPVTLSCRDRRQACRRLLLPGCQLYTHRVVGEYIVVTTLIQPLDKQSENSFKYISHDENLQ